MTCQAVENGAVCRKSRVESWEVALGEVEAFIDLCEDHSRLVLETHPGITAQVEGWKPKGHEQ